MFSPFAPANTFRISSLLRDLQKRLSLFFLNTLFALVGSQIYTTEHRCCGRIRSKSQPNWISYKRRLRSLLIVVPTRHCRVNGAAKLRLWITSCDHNLWLQIHHLFWLQPWNFPSGAFTWSFYSKFCKVSYRNNESLKLKNLWSQLSELESTRSCQTVWIKCLFLT